jgi:hypothetical protein
VEFLEKFGDKHVYIISGNHCKKGDGSTAIDFLGEVKKPNWHIFTRPSAMNIEGLRCDFLPYMLKSELGVESDKDATKKIIMGLMGGGILFAHHAISGTTWGGISTEMMKEVILPRKILEKNYQLTVAGHIHEMQDSEKITVLGSVFTDAVGETEKWIMKIDTASLSLKKTFIRLPVRPLVKVTIDDTTTAIPKKIPNSAIVKVIVTSKSVNIEEVKEATKRFDATLLLEQYPNERVKAHIEDGAFDFSLPALLKLYAESKKLDVEVLLKGLSLIEKDG